LPFAAGNFLGPVVLGRLFDTILSCWSAKNEAALTEPVVGNRLRLPFKGCTSRRDSRLEALQPKGWPALAS
jgi:hypothetical protein